MKDLITKITNALTPTPIVPGQRYRRRDDYNNPFASEFSTITVLAVRSGYVQYSMGKQTGFRTDHTHSSDMLAFRMAYKLLPAHSSS